MRVVHHQVGVDPRAAAGERAERASQALLPGNAFYIRWSLFNPDRLFARMVPALRWVWTRGFFAFS